MLARAAIAAVLLAGVGPHDDHWALTAPHRPAVPEVTAKDWPKNPIDHFVLARLEKLGLRPEPEAPRAILARRLYLDVLGLVPTVEELDRFLADERPDAYERLVDELLASKHYGERQARLWLDLARYADTNGFEKDRPRSMWPYRDWVINAFNADMPFDEFTIKQIAGDMLESPTLDDRIATGFHRNTMINEEGGIDVEEYRWHAVVDRVNTTSTVWLGLTMACAQCHDHKYDPLTQADYWRMFAFFNNADEPEIPVPDPKITARRKPLLAEIARREARLADEFPVPDNIEWRPVSIVGAQAHNGTTLQERGDGVVEASGELPARDVYTIRATTDVERVTAIRLEALAAGGRGPGRTPHGNFVVTEIGLSKGTTKLALRHARADFSQTGFPVANAIDGRPGTGWAIDGAVRHHDRRAVFELAEPVAVRAGEQLVFSIAQTYGGQHTLGRFRLSVGTARQSGAKLEDARRAHLEAKLEAWIANTRAKARHWTALAPTRVVSENGATMTVQGDRSVLVSGDWPQTDTYVFEAATDMPKVTGLRLEALPDASLPEGGPGRAPLFKPGDFLLGEIEIEAGATRVEIGKGTQDYAHSGRPASLAFDGVLETGWSIEGRTGEPHQAVFAFTRPVVGPTKLRIVMRQHGIHQMTLGRFRISLTGDADPIACGVPADVEAILLDDHRSDAERARLREQFLAVAPELADARRAIVELRKRLPKYPTTLVMKERKPEHDRTTHLYKRGEYTRPAQAVSAALPGVLGTLPSGPRNRLALSRWLVSDDNPLVGRVVVNRMWHSVFGRGLVKTVADFGTRGSPPSHPELLDWLATEFPREGWSFKRMLRLIVTSATYRQASSASPDKWRRDPDNEWLARGPRFRVDAEVLRDLCLTASGLLNRKVGGPSVFPPQPDGVTSLSYGAMKWRTSTGPDRYRRGLYTFQKRTSPYAAFATFDAPSGENCVARRARSNSPLQALTMLNDTVFTEAARALARWTLARAGTRDADRVRFAFRSCISREPTADESSALLAFVRRQRERFERGELDAKRLAGATSDGNAVEIAAWMALSRVLLNLDETVTKG